MAAAALSIAGLIAAGWELGGPFGALGALVLLLYLSR
jgi:hypothetical protein